MLVSPTTSLSTGVKRTLDIKTIDLSGIEKDANHFNHIASLIAAECSSTGFFLLRMPQDICSQVPIVMEAVKEFFKLPLEEKLKLNNDEMSQMYINGTNIQGTGSGYRGIASDPNFKADARESFNIGPDVDISLVTSKGYSGSGVTKWPSQTILPGWKAILTKYANSLLAISRILQQLFAVSLGLYKNFFDEQGFFDRGTWLLGLVHYSATVSDGAKGIYGIKPHSDSGMFTLLLGDGQPGLQVCLDKEASVGQRVWLEVDPPPPGHLVVNLGQVLERWSGGRFKATMHRVMLDGTKERWSVPFFYDPNIDCSIKPLVESDVSSKSSYMPKSLGHLMLERLKKEENDFE